MEAGVKLAGMFTGIVRAVGQVRERTARRIWVSREGLPVALGASVAVNGVCLTVAELADEAMAFDLSGETLSRTNLGELRVGDRVNLEPSLRVGEELGGHLVLGHVDTVGKITVLSRRGEDLLLEVSFDPRFAELLADKGAVAVDGVSLTPFAVGEGTFRCAIVPHTYAHTNLRFRRVGDRVNLEFDILAKYVRRWREK
ncbi:MAG: riboflavin synthase [Candidatus Bipolaricaulaceae bacterium]